MVDPLRHTLHLYKIAGATQDFGGGTSPVAVSWSAREPSGPPPDCMTVALSTGEIGFNISGRFLVNVSGACITTTVPVNSNTVFELQIKPKGGSFAAVDKGQKTQLNLSATVYRAFGISSLVKIRAGDTLRLVNYVAAAAGNNGVTTFNALQMCIIGMGQITP